MISTSSSRVQRKRELERLLREGAEAAIQDWVQNDTNPNAVLFSLLFAQDDLLRWRVIDALGRLIGSRFDDDPDYVRDQIRRLFWSMSDESGNVMWHAPEVIGEILASAPDLIDEYANQLCSFLVEEPFERGSYWAVARLTAINPAPFQERIEDIAEGLANPDPAIRGFAIIALQRLAFHIPEDLRSLLEHDAAEFEVFDTEANKIITQRVSETLGKDS